MSDRALTIAVLCKIFVLTIIMCGFTHITFKVLEPGGLLAQTTASDTVIVNLSVDAGITISAPADVNMSRNLSVVANNAIASTTWNVKTNNALGYQLQVKSSTTPAMRSTTTGATIADYQTGAPNTWSVTSGNVNFGFSAYGTDVSTATWGTGSSCGTSHTPSATQKFKGFTTSNVQVSTRSNTTTPSGIDTTVCFAVEQNGFYTPSGNYQATIIATASTL